MAHPYFITRNDWGNSPISEENPQSDRWIINQVEGFIRSHHVGLTGTGVRIRVGRRVDLCVKWPSGKASTFVTGQRAVVMIPGKAVRLEAGLFRRSKQHVNRWYGRIVLIEQSPLGHVITVKVHGESWALKCTRPIVGSNHQPRTWDQVNIVVDPHAIQLVPSYDQTLFDLNAWGGPEH